MGFKQSAWNSTLKNEEESMSKKHFSTVSSYINNSLLELSTGQKMSASFKNINLKDNVYNIFHDMPEFTGEFDCNISYLIDAHKNNNFYTNKKARKFCTDWLSKYTSKYSSLAQELTPEFLSRNDLSTGEVMFFNNEYCSLFLYKVLEGLKNCILSEYKTYLNQQRI